MSRNKTIAKILDGYTDDISKDVLEGIAEAIWVTSYANYAEENPDDDDIERAGGGEDWYDVVPEVPAAAYQAADVLGKSFEAQNQTTLGALAWDARGVATGKMRTMNMGDFARAVGRVLAMEAMGTGVAWTDDHPAFGHIVPDFEAHFDGTYLEWSPREPTRGGGRALGRTTMYTPRGGGAPVAYKQWYVVRVGGDDRDTHAAETLAAALELANADEGSRLEFGMVEARDAGAARILRPARWMKVNPSAFTKKGERMYKSVRAGYRAAGDARAAEIAARTVLSAAKHGSKGLVRNPDALAIGELVVTPDNEVGRVVQVDGDEAQVIHEDRVMGRGPWYFATSTLLEPHADAAREYTEACAQLAKPRSAGG